MGNWLVAGKKAKGALDKVGAVAGSVVGKALGRVKSAASDWGRRAMIDALRKNVGELWAKGVVASLGLNGLGGSSFDGALMLPAPPWMAGRPLGEDEARELDQAAREVLSEALAREGYKLESIKIDWQQDCGQMRVGLRLEWMGKIESIAANEAVRPRISRSGHDIEDVEYKER